MKLFSNEGGQRWLHRPNTILVDSRQLESDDGLSADFKKLSAHQIEEFKSEYRRRFPGRDTEKLTDEDLMREVLNTVGKKGKLGEHVRCVVSVSMLTEGWDCNTVTHILGVRAFGTRLLCEQVMGRGLRRRSYAVGDDGMLAPEYADIFGVPFSGFPVAGLPEERAPATPKPGKAVRAVPERLAANPWLEVTFPRVVGYRFDVPAERLAATFDAAHREVLTTQDLPTSTLNAPIYGEKAELTLTETAALRPQTVAFQLATHLQQYHFPDKPWLFPQLLGIVRDWLGDRLRPRRSGTPLTIAPRWRVGLSLTPVLLWPRARSPSPPRASPSRRTSTSPTRGRTSPPARPPRSPPTTGRSGSSSPATARSTRSSCGRARTSRTPARSTCPPSRSTSRRRSTRKPSSRT